MIFHNISPSAFVRFFIATITAVFVSLTLPLSTVYASTVDEELVAVSETPPPTVDPSSNTLLGAATSGANLHAGWFITKGPGKYDVVVVSSKNPGSDGNEITADAAEELVDIADGIWSRETRNMYRLSFRGHANVSLEEEAPCNINSTTPINDALVELLGEAPTPSPGSTGIMVVSVIETPCWFGGLGWVGAGLSLLTEKTWNPERPDIMGTYMAHEFGHNFRLMHSGAYTCENPSPAYPQDQRPEKPCSADEYGDRSSLMGLSSTNAGFPPVRIPAQQLEKLKVLNSSNVRSIGNGGSGEYYLGDPAGNSQWTTKMLDVGTLDGKRQTLEYRPARLTSPAGVFWDIEGEKQGETDTYVDNYSGLEPRYPVVGIPEGVKLRLFDGRIITVVETTNEYAKVRLLHETAPLVKSVVRVGDVVNVAVEPPEGLAESDILHYEYSFDQGSTWVKYTGALVTLAHQNITVDVPELSSPEFFSMRVVTAASAWYSSYPVTISGDGSDGGDGTTDPSTGTSDGSDGEGGTTDPSTGTGGGDKNGNEEDPSVGNEDEQSPSRVSYEPVEPVRVLDTRIANGNTRSLANMAYGVKRGDVLTVKTEGKIGEIPDGVKAAVVNITTTGVLKSTELRAGNTRPTSLYSATIHARQGRTIAETLIVPVDPSGEFQLRNVGDGKTHLVVDLKGWFAGETEMFTAKPETVFTTSNVDGLREQGNGVIIQGKLSPQSTAVIPITDKNVTGEGNVRTALVRVTATESTDNTYLSVYDGVTRQPSTSTLNVEQGVTVSNTAIVNAAADGTIKVYNDKGYVRVDVELLGMLPSDFPYTPVEPSRFSDTREGSQTVDGESVGGESLNTQGVMSVPVLGRGGVPSEGVAAVVVNLTAVKPTISTFITAQPSGLQERLTVSTVNPQKGGTAANMALVPVGEDGSIELYNEKGTVDVVVDVLGWIQQS